MFLRPEGIGKQFLQKPKEEDPKQELDPLLNLPLPVREKILGTLRADLAKLDPKSASDQKRRTMLLRQILNLEEARAHEEHGPLIDRKVLDEINSADHLRHPLSTGDSTWMPPEKWVNTIALPESAANDSRTGENEKRA